MATKQHTRLVPFDEIPGQLPQSTVGNDVELDIIAQTAVAALNRLKPESFAPYAIWRDLLSLTDTYRTFYSAESVVGTLRKLCEAKKTTSFEPKGGQPRRVGIGPIGWLDIDVLFETEEDSLRAECAGTVSVITNADGTVEIWQLRTWLECYRDHGHPDQPRLHAPSNDPSPVVLDVIVIGGGQGGLSVAGRLHALGVSYITFEKHRSIGDSWATRYESLKWHTGKEYGNLPFGSTFLPEDDYFVPIERIGAGYRAYAEKYGLNIQLETMVTSAAWDQVSQSWTVKTMNVQMGPQEWKARNIVLCNGGRSATPVRPTWASEGKIKASGFKGQVIHSIDYKTMKPWAGRRGIVVGTANTGHDVAEDMANAGMTTTMLQRNATFVLPVDCIRAADGPKYTATVANAQADREACTVPLKVQREMARMGTHAAIRSMPDRFDALERAGFQLDRFGDIFTNIYVRAGGHYVDTGASRRIAAGEIRVKTQPVDRLSETGVVFDDGSEVEADVIVLATGFDHDFRRTAAKILGDDVAYQMDDYWGTDSEGEIRGYGRLSGHPSLYYFGGDTRMTRFFSRFVALQIQKEILGHPLKPYLGTVERKQPS